MSLSDFNYETWIIKSRLNKELQILDKEVTGTENKNVLDAGSGGDEHYYKEFVARGLKIIRMDINADNLRSANRNSDGNNAYLLAGDINHIPLADESVDVLFLCEVLEHLNAPEKALREAHRVLKRGGYIFVDVPWLSEIYRPLSAILLRNFVSFKHNGRPPLLFKILYKNLDEIDRLEDSSLLRETTIGSILIRLARLFPVFRTFGPKYFVYNYYHGSMPEGNMHLQFRFPKEWVETVRSSGFRLVKKTGAFVTPPLFARLKLCNFLFSKLEDHMGDNLALPLSQVLILVAIKL
jgi:ubiquinone/menaquinone biosynthesis C-methylase UbiE